MLDRFVHTAFGRKGWMVPNQYWTPGVLAPMPIMGKYYMYYGQDFLPPRQLGRINAERMVQELLDGQPGHLPLPPRLGRGDGRGDRRVALREGEGVRGEGDDDRQPHQQPQLVGLLGSRGATPTSCTRSSSGAATWATSIGPNCDEWIARFETDRREAALDFWYEMHKGAHESLLEF